VEKPDLSLTTTHAVNWLWLLCPARQTVNL